MLRCGQAHGKNVCFSPDGSRLIASLDQETIGFWDVDSGRLARRWHAGPSAGAHVPLLSADGRSLLVGGRDRPLQLWEVASGKERCRFDKTNTGGYAVAALSPDSRILAAWTGYMRPIQLWSLMTGALLGKLDVTAIPASPLCMTFSPDSQFLATALNDGTAVIWDVARLAAAPKAAVKHSARPLKELWSELASEDAAKAYAALRALACAPEQSLPLLRQHVAESARSKADPARIARLLVELDSAEYEVREKASRSLQELGIVAEAAMRRVLREQPSLEVRRRLEPILDKLESVARPPDQLRISRAVEVMELIGSAEARQILREWSQSPPDSWLTQEAKLALARLAVRP